VRGEIPDSGSFIGRGIGPAFTGCRAPQWAQWMSSGAAWFPHWLQYGIPYSQHTLRQTGLFLQDS